MTGSQQDKGRQNKGFAHDKGKGEEKDNSTSTPQLQGNRLSYREADIGRAYNEAQASEEGSYTPGHITEEDDDDGFFIPEVYDTNEKRDSPDSQGTKGYPDTPSPRSNSDVSYWECDVCGKYDIPINRNGETDRCPVGDCGHERCRLCPTYTERRGTPEDERSEFEERELEE